MVRWDPLRDLAAMLSEMERLIARLGGTGGATGVLWTPASNVIESDDEIVITAELPVVRTRTSKSSLTMGSPRITGERRLQDEIKRNRCYRILRVVIPKPQRGQRRRVPRAAG
jgi:HSP20 family molecular chaperone IbpA